VRQSGPDSTRLSSRHLRHAAGLATRWRLALGAAHSLNNALTAILGEASFLRAEHKRDPDVVEACDSIVREVERCGRLTRALLSRRQRSAQGDSGVDLVRLVGDLGRLLAQTLGSRIELDLDLPDDLLLVNGDPESVELLCLLLVHYAADVQPGASRLRVSAARGPEPAEVVLCVTLRAAALPDATAAAVLDPEQAEPALQLALEAARCVSADLGSRLEARQDPHRVEIRLVLRALDDCQ
jgi:signal transduction histidine kinase